jgi:uncharacterized protein (TIGR02145 family)
MLYIYITNHNFLSMKTFLLTGFIVCTFATTTMSQVSISHDGSNPDPTAMLEIKSTDKGFLPPRLTTEQRNSITTPAEGLLIFNTTTGCIDYFLGGSWKSLGGATEPAFQCGMKMTDNRDGKKYNTVKIGQQCWMQESLNAGVKSNGTVEQVNNLVIEKYCYNDLEVNCSMFGGLYQWGEVTGYLNGASNYGSWNPVPTGNVQGICPDGWHLPSMTEWDSLINFLGGPDIAGGPMKEPGTFHWSDPNTGGSNSSGFSALPGGYYENSSGYLEVTNYAYFWSSSETYSAGAWSWYINSQYEYAAAYNHSKQLGLSVRCVMN